MKKSMILWIGAILAACGTLPAERDATEMSDLRIEEVYAQFREPSTEARAFMRWWWNDNRVESGELVRELDIMADAGIGGIEINPLERRVEAGPDSVAKALVWRSREWDEMLKHAATSAQDRGMIVDLIAGSGWPFGGEFLEPDEQVMRVMVIDQHVSGPTTYRLDLDELFSKPYVFHRQEGYLVNPSLQFARLYPVDLNSLAQVSDHTAEVDEEGVLEFAVGQGEYVVSLGIHEIGFREVMHGAPGAMGPTMDHLSAEVTRAYLNRLADVEETWGEPLSAYVRAVFCDSIETGGQNWTHDVLDTFMERKGYRIDPFLPFVIRPEEEVSAEMGAELLTTVRRARYDWNEHQAYLFNERFAREFHQFCHDNGLLSRYQAYGLPYLLGMAEGYMIPDIPESNLWIYDMSRYDDPYFMSNQGHGTMVWTKYTTAGGRLRNKRIMSSEAMTLGYHNTFQATLGSMKQFDDMNFVGGINHSVLHGFNYNPPDVPFPGWIRYGAYFSEWNTWWEHFPLWVERNARLSQLFQTTRPVAEVAMIGPAPDIWSIDGLARVPFHMKPIYFHLMWEALSQMGIGNDYLHEDVVQQADMSGGTLKYGPMEYKILVVGDMESMQPETAAKIAELAANGGKVVYLNQVPVRAPGLKDPANDDPAVRRWVTASLRSGAIKLNVDPNERALRPFLSSLITTADLNPIMRVESPRDGLFQIHTRTADADVIFFTNTYRRESSQTRVQFPVGTRGLWRWDPESGERLPYPLAYDEGGFWVDLQPLESVLIVVTGERSGAVPAGNAFELASSVEIGGRWDIDLQPARGGTPFVVEDTELFEFTESDQEALRYFSGEATYRIQFEVKHGDFDAINLGWDNGFISEIVLNGTSLGVNWYGSQNFDLQGSLKEGENVLEVHYTTTLNNLMAREDARKALQKTGLMGPVRLIRWAERE